MSSWKVGDLAILVDEEGGPVQVRILGLISTGDGIEYDVEALPGQSIEWGRAQCADSELRAADYDHKAVTASELDEACARAMGWTVDELGDGRKLQQRGDGGTAACEGHFAHGDLRPYSTAASTLDEKIAWLDALGHWTLDRVAGVANGWIARCFVHRSPVPVLLKESGATIHEVTARLVVERGRVQRESGT